MRIILFTGKGGVGKTTCAAATALASADRGLRTAVISTDPAHSLADALDVELSDELTEVLAPNCWACQLDAQHRMEQSWGELREYLRAVLDRTGLDGIEAEELSVVPGIDEVFALADIKSFAVDGSAGERPRPLRCVPIVETIRLLSLPDILSWYMERLFPVGRRLNRAVGPPVARLTHLPAASDEVFGAAASFYDRLDGVRDLLVAPSSTIRMVLTPERVVVAESRRTYTYLSLFGYRVDAVIANRLLPDEVTDPWFDRWRADQQATMADLERDLAPRSFCAWRWRRRRCEGSSPRARSTLGLYRTKDPTAVLHEGASMRFDIDGDRAGMSLHIPLVERSSIDLRRSTDELIVTVGQHPRARWPSPSPFRHRGCRARPDSGEHLDVEFASVGSGRSSRS